MTKGLIQKMAREKKNGRFLNCYVQQDIYDRLSLYSKETMIPKTAIVERALEEYLKAKCNSENEQTE
jgi:hypothetical protein